MRLKDIPWFNQPWTKLKRDGIQSLDDAELLATIFIRGNPDENAIEVANKLLSKYNLHQFADCSLKELQDILGEDIKAYQIQSLSQLFIRHSKLERKGYGRTYHRAIDIFNKFIDEFQHKKKEYFIGLLLNSQNEIIRKITISKGTLDTSLVHPREVFKPAIKESAHSIILVHNHPSGDPAPSQQDIIITQNIRKAGELLKIPLKDHVIIGDNGYYSFREEGKLT